LRFASLDHFGLGVWRMIGIGSACAIVSAMLVGFAVGGSLGQAKAATLVVVAILVFYIVLSTPRRILDSQRVAQARESLMLSASATACLSVTGSRAKTLILLRPRDPTLVETASEAGRMVLLGERVESAVARSSDNLASYSASTALISIASMSPREFGTRDEEARGLTLSSELSRETKLPMFMTICFFTPIMLVLYAVFTRSYDPTTLAELAAFEFVAIDLAFYLSAADRGPR